MHQSEPSDLKCSRNSFSVQAGFLKLANKRCLTKTTWAGWAALSAHTQRWVQAITLTALLSEHSGCPDEKLGRWCKAKERAQRGMGTKDFKTTISGTACLKISEAPQAAEFMAYFSALYYFIVGRGLPFENLILHKGLMSLCLQTWNLSCKWVSLSYGEMLFNVLNNEK